MKTLSQLINNRPAHRHRFLEILLEFTAHEKQEVDGFSFYHFFHLKYYYQTHLIYSTINMAYFFHDFTD